MPDDRLDILQRNLAWSANDVPSSWYTQLQAHEEPVFRSWVQQNKIPFNPDEQFADYDMRGYWKALMAGDPTAVRGVDPNDQKWHFPDVWKTPFHESFSAESRYAAPNAPRWKGNTLITPEGTVVYEDKPKQKAKDNEL